MQKSCYWGDVYLDAAAWLMFHVVINEKLHGPVTYPSEIDWKHHLHRALDFWLAQPVHVNDEEPTNEDKELFYDLFL